jgi:hypothetical protein
MAVLAVDRRCAWTTSWRDAMSRVVERLKATPGGGRTSSVSTCTTSPGASRHISSSYKPRTPGAANAGAPALAIVQHGAVPTQYISLTGVLLFHRQILEAEFEFPASATRARRFRHSASLARPVRGRPAPEGNQESTRHARHDEMRYHRSRPWILSYVCCLAPEDGQGSGSAGQCETSRPLYGIRPKASKGLNRRRRVLQDPHSWVPCPAADRRLPDVDRLGLRRPLSPSTTSEAAPELSESSQ